MSLQDKPSGAWGLILGIDINTHTHTMIQRCRNTHRHIGPSPESQETVTNTHIHGNTKCHICINIHTEKCILLSLKSQERVFNTQTPKQSQRNIRTQHPRSYIQDRTYQLAYEQTHAQTPTRYIKFRNKHAHTHTDAHIHILVIKVQGRSHRHIHRHNTPHTHKG